MTSPSSRNFEVSTRLGDRNAVDGLPNFWNARQALRFGITENLHGSLSYERAPFLSKMK
jgi:hypothetical protein